MIKTIRNAWKLPELRRKLLFVVFALLIFRLGAAVPVPYINTEMLQEYISANSGTIFGLLNTLSGSAMSRATVFALSIQPYINASIIIQLHPGHRPDPGLWLLRLDPQLQPAEQHRRVGRPGDRGVLHRRRGVPDVAG